VYKRVGKPVIFFTVIVIAVITFFTVVMVKDIRFGIDIKGGIDVTFTPPAGTAVSTNDMNKAIKIINTRLDNQNILDREVIPDYTHKRIIVRFPPKAGEKTFDPEQEIKDLGSMAQLVFKSTSYNNNANIITGKDVKSAAAKVDSTGAYYVELNLYSSGVKAFDAATKALYANKGNLVIFMDNKQIESAGVDAEIDNGSAVIQGGFTASSAKNLADTINAGSLPYALVTNNFSTIAPTLGQSALQVMVWAGLVAFILICLFMIFYYRLPGFIAIIALVGHIAGTLLFIKIPGITLTLPGIAGIILSIGMGVDCNVITFERVKEELRLGKTLDGAIDAGFDRSFSAIFDGNVTVIIVGAILWFMGSATVKSFGYTLMVGVIFNFIMGIIASRIMLRSVSRFHAFRKNTLYTTRRAES
jgi:preprotein translocase subunit SecD